MRCHIRRKELDDDVVAIVCDDVTRHIVEQEEDASSVHLEIKLAKPVTESGSILPRSSVVVVRERHDADVGVTERAGLFGLANDNNIHLLRARHVAAERDSDPVLLPLLPIPLHCRQGLVGRQSVEQC